MRQWDKIFKSYGKVFTEPQEDIPRIVKLLKKKGIKNILDLGCGSGRHTVYLAKHGFKVYGIDIAPKGIKIAKDWLKKEKVQADLKIGSIYKKLPYQNDFFDAVISTQTIHHGKIKNIRKAIKEVERVLRPKGLLFITVPKSRKEVYGKKIKLIEPRTWLPLKGREAGLPHYLYTKNLLKRDFNKFKIHDIWVESDKRHYCLLGELKD